MSQMLTSISTIYFISKTNKKKHKLNYQNSRMKIKVDNNNNNKNTILVFLWFNALVDRP